MTPYYGQGAGISLEDAYVLSSLLGKCTTQSDLAAAFKAYDYSRVPRGCRIIAASREQGNLLCFESPEAGDNLEKVAERLDWDVGVGGEPISYFILSHDFLLRQRPLPKHSLSSNY
jgi:2-polyprenyl-6-methoxyphenol hydroxylase-like FAD-dependent oxidoreductase